MGQVVMNLELLIPTPSLSSGWFQSWWPHLRIETLQVSLPYDSNFDSMQITKGISPCPGCYRPRGLVWRGVASLAREAPVGAVATFSSSKQAKRKMAFPMSLLAQQVSQNHQDDKEASEHSTRGLIYQGYLQRGNTEAVLSYHFRDKRILGV